MDKHEKIDWVEFPATDMDATKAFFDRVFGWSFTDYGLEYEHHRGWFPPPTFRWKTARLMDIRCRSTVRCESETIQMGQQSCGEDALTYCREGRAARGSSRRPTNSCVWWLSAHRH